MARNLGRRWDAGTREMAGASYDAECVELRGGCDGVVLAFRVWEVMVLRLRAANVGVEGRVTRDR